LHLASNSEMPDYFAVRQKFPKLLTLGANAPEVPNPRSIFPDSAKCPRWVASLVALGATGSPRKLVEREGISFFNVAAYRQLPTKDIPHTCGFLSRFLLRPIMRFPPRGVGPLGETHVRTRRRDRNHMMRRTATDSVTPRLRSCSKSSVAPLRRGELAVLR